MKDKLMALAGDLREQAATVLETIYSMAQAGEFSEMENMENYADQLSTSLIDIADEIEQIADTGEFKERLTGLRWVSPDPDSYLYLRYENVDGKTQTEIYGWIRQEGFLWIADVQKAPGHFECVGTLPTEGIVDIFLLQNIVADLAHEVTPIILEGAKYLDA
jgi:hypothetical protein